MIEEINLTPSPISLVESLRDIGYTLETAISDIIDNSITANSENINIEFRWENDNSWISIIDDGNGMTQKELINAMRFGSQNPLEIRDQNDLGRFGLGLKTASFSQARVLTVLSKKENLTSIVEWDLDYLKESENGWKLKLIDNKNLFEKSNVILNMLFSQYLENLKSGTIVLLRKLDRFILNNSDKLNQKFFDSSISSVEEHLKLVFHRFISGDAKNKKINIFMNQNKLEAFNPFYPKKSTELEDQEIIVEGSSVTIKPYILPHFNKISRDEFNKFAGEEGYLQNQGFYIYRNRRLIIKGDWFKLIKKAELTKLLRVQIDIPNTLDHLWKIDIKKSHASPPEIVKKELKQIIGRIKFAGEKVIKRTGTIIKTPTKPVWLRVARDNFISYEINREHPLIQNVLKKLSGENKTNIKEVFSIIESTFPSNFFYRDMAENPKSFKLSSIDEEKFRKLFDLFIVTWENDNASKEKIIEDFRAAEPFSSNIDLTDELLTERGYFNE